MAAPTIKSGTKLNLRLESKLNDTNFVLKSTFEKNVDEASFLISVPMRDGKILMIDETDKIYIDYGTGDSHFAVEGFVDDYVKKGPRTYLKVRKTTVLKRYEQRADVRIKAQIKVEVEKTYWLKNGMDSKEQVPGLTMDISNGGVAIYLNAQLGTGEIIEIRFPRRKGAAAINVRGETCWVRETEKGNAYRYLAGLRFFLNYAEENEKVVKYVAAVAASETA